MSLITLRDNVSTRYMTSIKHTAIIPGMSLTRMTSRWRHSYSRVAQCCPIFGLIVSSVMSGYFVVVLCVSRLRNFINYNRPTFILRVILWLGLLLRTATNYPKTYTIVRPDLTPPPPSPPLYLYKQSFYYANVPLVFISLTRWNQPLWLIAVIMTIRDFLLPFGLSVACSSFHGGWSHWCTADDISDKNLHSLRGVLTKGDIRKPPNFSQSASGL